MYVSSDINLHPTMYLLIHVASLSSYHLITNLHPTMYLLIPSLSRTTSTSCTYLHPTMYLLIRLQCSF